MPSKRDQFKKGIKADRHDNDAESIKTDTDQSVEEGDNNDASSRPASQERRGKANVSKSR